MDIYGKECACHVLQVFAIRVFRRRQRASKDLVKSGRLVSGRHLLPVPLRQKGTCDVNASIHVKRSYYIIFTLKLCSQFVVTILHVVMNIM